MSEWGPLEPLIGEWEGEGGLDYKTGMWRDDEENPFHTEVGYWLWDGATNEVTRGFVVPRGITVLAGGTAAADATEFTITTTGDTWSYRENTVLKMNEFPEPFDHRDHNTLRRVG